VKITPLHSTNAVIRQDSVLYSHHAALRHVA
jgi:hypothetical protein